LSRKKPSDIPVKRVVSSVWTAVHRSINLTTTGQPDKHAELAATELARMWQERSLERIRQVLAANSWPDGWADAARSSSSRRFLTAAEAIAVSDEIKDIAVGVAGRRPGGPGLADRHLRAPDHDQAGGVAPGQPPKDLMNVYSA
jgi:hypothetical protein